MYLISCMLFKNLKSIKQTKFIVILNNNFCLKLIPYVLKIIFLYKPLFFIYTDSVCS